MWYNAQVFKVLITELSEQWLDDRIVVRFPTGTRNLHLIRRVRISFEVRLASYTVQGALLNVAKRWGFEGVHASTFIDQVQIERGIPLIPPKALWRIKRQLYVYVYLCLITSFSATRLVFRSRGSAVTVNTRLRAGHSKVRFPTRANCYILDTPRPALQPTQPPVRRVQGSFPSV